MTTKLIAANICGEGKAAGNIVACLNPGLNSSLLSGISKKAGNSPIKTSEE